MASRSRGTANRAAIPAKQLARTRGRSAWPIELWAIDAFPAAAQASVVSTVANGTLTITADAAADRITVKPGGFEIVLVNDQSSRA